MKLIWKTAYAAYRLSLQTGSDDGYYPGPEYKFAHGSKRERKAVNRALDIIKAPDDKMKGRAPGLILVKQANRKRAKADRWGPPTLFQYNCRCAVVQIGEVMAGALLFGKAEDGPRTMHGLVAPDFATVDESTLTKRRERHKLLLASVTNGVDAIRKQIEDMGLDPSTGVIVAPPGQSIPDFPLKAHDFKFEWVTKPDKSTTRPIHKPGDDNETPKAEE